MAIAIDRRIVTAAVDAVLRISDVTNRAASHELEIRIEDVQTEGIVRELRIIVLAEAP